MTQIRNLPASLSGLVLGLAAIGAACYLAAQGSISGGDAIAIVGVVLGGAGGIVGAHVGGTVAVTAAGASAATQAGPATGEPAQGPANTQPAAVTGLPATGGVTGG